MTRLWFRSQDGVVNGWKTIGAIALALVLWGPSLRAQVRQADPRSVNPSSPIQPIGTKKNDGYNKPPIPSERGVPKGRDLRGHDPSQAEPDQHTLASVEDTGVGSLEGSHNRFDPSVMFTQGGQSGYPGSTAQTGLASMTLLGGRVDFDRTWKHYRLVAFYNGGETVYHPNILQNLAYHNFDIGHEITWSRWMLRARYDFLASPQADFGGQGMGGPGMWGGISAGPGDALPAVIGTNFVPSETILTGQAMRLRHTALGEVDYAWSRRSRFTLAGSYGMLHFDSSGYLSSRGFTGQAGYEYSVGPKNTIGVLGTYGRTDFDGTRIFADTYSAELSFGRKITGRLALQFAAGPQQIRLLNSSAGDTRIWTWATRDALTYQRRRTGLSLSFMHGFAGGSGVLFGARSQTFTATLSRQFTRLWMASVSSGYAINSGLGSFSGISYSYNTWFSGVNVGHEMGRHFHVNFSYGIQRQTNAAVCPVVSCGTNANQHTFGMTVRWHLLRAE